MNLFGNDCFPQNSSMPSEDDILIKKLLLTHDPDGRSLDSELLLRAMENVMCYAATSQVLQTTKLPYTFKQFFIFHFHPN